MIEGGGSPLLKKLWRHVAGSLEGSLRSTTSLAELAAPKRACSQATLKCMYLKPLTK